MSDDRAEIGVMGKNPSCRDLKGGGDTIEVFVVFRELKEKGCLGE